MTDYIIIGVLAIILFFCVRSSLKHFRGEGGCCGGGASYKARPKRLNTVAGRKTVMIEGMSCQHCVNRVMEAVNSIDGASGIVKLKKGLVIVSMDHPIDDETIRNAIEKEGYKVLEIKDGFR